jgi:hypothetical protein
MLVDVISIADKLLVTLAIPAMVTVEPPPTGLILLTFSILILFDYL